MQRPFLVRYNRACCQHLAGRHKHLSQFRNKKQTDVEVGSPTEPKAVLEHRAPKTSPPILHSRSAESKVGRAVHCAPELVMQTRLLGWNPAVRALTSAATSWF